MIRILTFNFFLIDKMTRYTDIEKPPTLHGDLIWYDLKY